MAYQSVITLQDYWKLFSGTSQVVTSLTFLICVFQTSHPSCDQHGHRERLGAQRESAPAPGPGPPHHCGVHAAGDGGEDQTRLRLLEPLPGVSRHTDHIDVTGSQDGNIQGGQNLQNLLIHL